MAYNFPITWGAGDALGVDELREGIASIEQVLDGGITLDMIEQGADGIVLDSNINLQGGKLLAARNVRSNEASARGYGVQGTGALVETEAIKSAISQAIAEGYRTLHFPAGLYLIDGPIQVPRTLSIVGDGPGTVIKNNDADGQGSPCFIVAGSGVVIGNMTFFSATSGSNIGISVSPGASDVHIEKVWGYDIGTLIQAASCSGIEIQTIFAIKCGTAVSFSAVSDSKIDAVRYNFNGVGTPKAGVSIAGGSNVTLSALNIYGAEHGVLVDGASGITVQAAVRKCGKSGVYFKSVTKSTVSDTHALSNSCESGEVWPGVRLDSCSAVYFDGISVSDESPSKQSYGVWVNGGTDNTVGPSVLLPNRGPDGTATDVTNTDYAVKDEGSGTQIIGCLPVAVGRPQWG